MNKPPLKTMILGNPIVGLGIYGLGALTLYGWWQNADAWPLGLMALVAMSTTARAGEQADAYRNWKRAWDAMGDDPLPSGRGGRVGRTIVGLTLIAAFVWYLASQSDRPGYDLALGWLVLGGVAMLVVAILAKWRKARRARPIKTTVVTVVVKGPVLRVPTLAEAYRALPDYCLRMG